MQKTNEITHAVIGAAIEVHRQLGPGLLESAYRECLCRELILRSIPFEREKPLPLEYKGIHLECGYRMDLLVAGSVTGIHRRILGYELTQAASAGER